MVGKRHASGEISAKLAQADELAAKGKTQREISKALGVSIMTYHRWKKMLHSTKGLTANSSETIFQSRPSGSAGNSADAIKRLEYENQQLRRIVTDMLLDKLKLEEELRARNAPALRRPDHG